MTAIPLVVGHMILSVLFLPFTGYMTIACFLEDAPPQTDFACSILFTLFLLELAEAVVTVITFGFLIWLGYRAFRWWQGVGMDIRKKSR